MGNCARMNKETSVIAVVQSLYQCISGGYNAERDWRRYTSLFLPNAVITVISSTSDNNTRIIDSTTVANYIDYFIRVIGDMPFYEKEVTHRIEFMDSYAIYWSDYEARLNLSSEPIYKGTNCFQLVFHEDKWSFISALWERKLKAEHLSQYFQPQLTSEPIPSGTG